MVTTTGLVEMYSFKDSLISRDQGVCVYGRVVDDAENNTTAVLLSALVLCKRRFHEGKSAPS